MFFFLTIFFYYYSYIFAFIILYSLYLFSISLFLPLNHSLCLFLAGKKQINYCPIYKYQLQRTTKSKSLYKLNLTFLLSPRGHKLTNHPIDIYSKASLSSKLKLNYFVTKLNSALNSTNYLSIELLHPARYLKTFNRAFIAT